MDKQITPVPEKEFEGEKLKTGENAACLYKRLDPISAEVRCLMLVTHRLMILEIKLRRNLSKNYTCPFILDKPSLGIRPVSQVEQPLDKG